MPQILDQLGYSESPHFLRDEELGSAEGYAHVLRRAKEECALRGVYVLRPDPSRPLGITPLVYVCDAQDEQEAHEIHRQVWNQNVVPFLLVRSPRHLRLYKGFSYKPGTAAANTNIFQSADLGNVLSLTVSADDIEQGHIWDRWGRDIEPDKRVDQVLLDALEELGSWLTDNRVSIQTAHALIGKFVYLRYLRDRKILSDRKLEKWGIRPQDVFGRNARLTAFEKVNDKLDDWLNGSVFPVPKRAVCYRGEHVRKVAAVFSGDEPNGQMHLNFRAYDFSAIPTETLSSIYEQFLHTTDPHAQETRGEKAGAHYTPVPLVNFTIDELEKQKPLEEGMRVLDPSCGSGAFLVHCYRRLIEKKRTQGVELTPHGLKQLLVENFYGVELYEDACQVAALNLTLTLLDNVDPPDLEDEWHEKFELPDLLGNNIFHADFFNPDSDWAREFSKSEFDWVIGNPPWKEVKARSREEGDVHASKWMASPQNEQHPATDHQLAEAFTWKVCDLLNDDGVVGLVLPAMTLTKQDKRFRRAFFAQNRVLTIVNLANLRKSLFYRKKSKGGRRSSPSAPAAIVCFRKGEPNPYDTILTYAPFAIDQIPTRFATRRIPWSFVVNSSDLRELSTSDVSDGSHLHWKVAMWGSPRDMRLVKRLKDRFETFEKFCERHHLLACEGIQLRDVASRENLDHMPKLIGKKRLDFSKLRGCGRIFEFPPESTSSITKEKAYLRIRGGRAGLDVSKPPHIIVDAARRFAVYSEEFLAVPPRRIGIGGSSDKALLKALASYLNSLFSVYHEFMDASEWGIKSARATLRSLRRLPVPDALSSRETIESWASLYDSLKRASENERAQLLEELNRAVFDVLSLSESERILVHDMVNCRLQLLDGKVPNRLLRPPSHEETLSYLSEFQRVLDSFVGDSYQHEVNAYLGGKAALLRVRLLSGDGKIAPRIVEANSDMSDVLSAAPDRLRKEHSQWLYFDRCLKVYDGPYMYVLKPLQMSQWLRSKALSDADDVIGEYIAVQGRM